MTINVYGVPTSIDALHWAQLFADQANAGSAMGVSSGLASTAPTGVRLVSVGAGRSVQAGSLAVSDATETVTLDAQPTSGQTRLDLVCMQVDWSVTTSTAGSIVVVKGAPAASPVRPTLSQNPGVLWQTPLAEVLVRFNVSQIASADVHDIRPPMGGRQRNSGVVTMTTTAGGTVAIPHGLGVTPRQFDVSTENSNTRCWVDYGGSSSTVSLVRVYRVSDNGLVGSASFRFHWKAEA